jgi:hypothetical protein
MLKLVLLFLQNRGNGIDNTAILALTSPVSEIYKTEVMV